MYMYRWFKDDFPYFIDVFFPRYPWNYFCSFVSTLMVGAFFGISDELLLVQSLDDQQEGDFMDII